jgi:hypothetical protein
MSDSAQAPVNEICYHHLVLDLGEETLQAQYRKSLLTKYREQAGDPDVGMRIFNQDLREGKLIQFTVAHHKNYPDRLGIAACSRKDSFSRELGNKIAEGRLACINDLTPPNFAPDAVGFPKVQKLQDPESNSNNPTYNKFLEVIRNIIVQKTAQSTESK